MRGILLSEEELSKHAFSQRTCRAHRPHATVHFQQLKTQQGDEFALHGTGEGVAPHAAAWDWQRSEQAGKTHAPRSDSARWRYPAICNIAASTFAKAVIAFVSLLQQSRTCESRDSIASMFTSRIERRGAFTGN
jgi:hypothetical protein